MPQSPRSTPQSSGLLRPSSPARLRDAMEAKQMVAGARVLRAKKRRQPSDCHRSLAGLALPALYTVVRIALIVVLSPFASFALDLLPLKPAINDFARMFPPASLEDLETRLSRFKAQTGDTIVVLTFKSTGRF